MKIFITGAGGGIAYLTGITLASRGHYVYLTTHTSGQKESIIDKIKGFENIEVLKFDVTSIKDRRLLDDLDIDVLISHAAIGYGGSILDLSIDKLRDNFEVNLFSSFEIIKDFINKRIRQKKGGKVLVTSSLSSSNAIPFLGSYSSTKAAITNLVQALQKELPLITNNINVVLVEPGAYKTGFNQVMIDGVYDSINDTSVFLDKKEKIYTSIKKGFNFLEEKGLNSIVVQIILAVETKNPKKVYRAPLIQSLGSKVMNIFK